MLLTRATRQKKIQKEFDEFHPRSVRYMQAREKQIDFPGTFGYCLHHEITL